MPSSTTAASVLVTSKPVLRKGEAVDLGEVEGESGVGVRACLRLSES